MLININFYDVALMSQLWGMHEWMHVGSSLRIYSWLCRGTGVHKRIEWDKEEVVVQAVRTAYWRTLRSRSSCQSARVCKERHSGHIPWSPWFLYGFQGKI